MISNPEVKRTLATSRKAKFGFLGVIVEKLSAEYIDLKAGWIFEAVFGDSYGCFLRSRYTSSSPPLALAVYADTLN